MAARMSQHYTGCRRALVVDDDGVVQLLMRIILERADYLVDCARDGLDACRKMEQTAYDAVVCDVLMPRMDGLSLHHHLRETRRVEAERMVFVSGVRLDPEEVRLLRGTGCRLLSKPFTAEELGAAVAEVAQPA